MFQVVFFLVLASAQDVFLASSASAARRLEGAADGSASGGTAILDCKSCIGRCKQSRGVKCKKFCVGLACVWQKDVQVEVCESCISDCKLKPGKNKCRQTCVNEKSCVWQAALDQAALDQAALDQAALDQAALDQEYQAAVDQALLREAARVAARAECSDDYPDYCAEHMDPFPMACQKRIMDICLADAWAEGTSATGQTFGPSTINEHEVCGRAAVFNEARGLQIYDVCKTSCNQCTEACKDTDGIRCADITSTIMGTRSCSLSISSINQDFFPGYSGDTSTKLSEVCKKSCEKC